MSSLSTKPYKTESKHPVLALKLWTDLTLRAGLVQLCSNTAELRVRKAESRDAAESPRIFFCSLQSPQAVFTGYKKKRAKRGQIPTRLKIWAGLSDISDKMSILLHEFSHLRWPALSAHSWASRTSIFIQRIPQELSRDQRPLNKNRVSLPEAPFGKKTFTLKKQTGECAVCLQREWLTTDFMKSMAPLKQWVHVDFSYFCQKKMMKNTFTHQNHRKIHSRVKYDDFWTSQISHLSSRGWSILDLVVQSGCFTQTAAFLLCRRLKSQLNTVIKPKVPFIPLCCL